MKPCENKDCIKYVNNACESNCAEYIIKYPNVLYDYRSKVVIDCPKYIDKSKISFFDLFKNYAENDNYLFALKRHIFPRWIEHNRTEIYCRLAGWLIMHKTEFEAIQILQKIKGELK